MQSAPKRRGKTGYNCPSLVFQVLVRQHPAELARLGFKSIVDDRNAVYCLPCLDSAVVFACSGSRDQHCRPRPEPSVPQPPSILNRLLSRFLDLYCPSHPTLSWPCAATNTQPKRTLHARYSSRPKTLSISPLSVLFTGYGYFVCPETPVCANLSNLVCLSRRCVGNQSPSGLTFLPADPSSQVRNTDSRLSPRALCCVSSCSAIGPYKSMRECTSCDRDPFRRQRMWRPHRLE